MLPLLFAAVAAVMASIADGVARTFARFDPLEAYRLDIMGSILGIVAFAALSFLRAPPVVWGLVVAALFLVLLRPGVRVIHSAALLALTATLLFETLDPAFSWSPYYRVTLIHHGTRAQIFVNGIPHQEASTIADRREREPFYFFPYERVSAKPRSMLIVGAGNGNDVAIALDEGVEHVDAVEIDPRLQQIGSEIHPERPYQDPRVDVHIQDGRAFLEQTERTYDLILFALPDSLTLVAGQSSLRLESYLFTKEAMESAREHLGARRRVRDVQLLP